MLPPQSVRVGAKKTRPINNFGQSTLHKGEHSQNGHAVPWCTQKCCKVHMVPGVQLHYFHHRCSSFAPQAWGPWLDLPVLLQMLLNLLQLTILGHFGHQMATFARFIWFQGSNEGTTTTGTPHMPYDGGPHWYLGQKHCPHW